MFILTSAKTKVLSQKASIQQCVVPDTDHLIEQQHNCIYFNENEADASVQKSVLGARPPPHPLSFTKDMYVEASKDKIDFDRIKVSSTRRPALKMTKSIQKVLTNC